MISRRSVLKHLVAVPAAATLVSCARGEEAGARVPTSTPPAGEHPASAAPARGTHIATHIDDVTTRQKQWPVRSLTSYSKADKKDLDPMPAKPTLIDFLKHRFLLAQHLLYTGHWALKQGLPEPVVLACLLHDTGHNIARPDHGYWAAQLLTPYVNEETAWAIQYHQALRFFPDPAFGYKGQPDFYKEYFGDETEPDPYIVDAYNDARKHKWYGSARLVTMSDQETPEPKDLYVGEGHPEFSPDEFTDLIGRNFKQPSEGLGYDGSPTAHMWRTIINPTRML